MIMHQGMTGAAMPLPLAGRGRSWRVTGIGGGDQTRRRLSELGFIEGAAVEVLQTDRQGAMVVRLGEARLALTGGMAAQVNVQ